MQSIGDKAKNAADDAKDAISDAAGAVKSKAGDAKVRRVWMMYKEHDRHDESLFIEAPTGVRTSQCICICWCKCFTCVGGQDFVKDKAGDAKDAAKDLAGKG